MKYAYSCGSGTTCRPRPVAVPVQSKFTKPSTDSTQLQTRSLVQGQTGKIPERVTIKWNGQTYEDPDGDGVWLGTKDRLVLTSGRYTGSNGSEIKVYGNKPATTPYMENEFPMAGEKIKRVTWTPCYNTADGKKAGLPGRDELMDQWCKQRGGELVPNKWELCSYHAQTYKRECRPVTCKKTSSDNYKLLELVDLSALLTAVGLGPIASLDQTICDYEKEAVIQQVINFLRGGNTLAGQLLSDMIPVNQYVIAAIQFGAGDFSETTLSLLEGVPGIGQFIGAAGTVSRALGAVWSDPLSSLNDLPVDTKEVIIDFVLDAMSLASSIPNPATFIIVPFVALITSTIMFGRKQWDEAVANIILLGLGRVVETATNSLYPVLEGPATAAGKLPEGLPTAFSNFIESLTPDKFMEFKQRITAAMRPVIDQLSGPIEKACKEKGWMDDYGRWTTEGKNAQNKALIAFKTFSTTNDVANGSSRIDGLDMGEGFDFDSKSNTTPGWFN